LYVAWSASVISGITIKSQRVRRIKKTFPDSRHRLCNSPFLDKILTFQKIIVSNYESEYIIEKLVNLERNCSKIFSKSSIGAPNKVQRNSNMFQLF
jgi:hypothetical protein